jgi:hypothetical protein
MRLTESDAKALLSKPGIRVASNSCHNVSDLVSHRLATNPVVSQKSADVIHKPLRALNKSCQPNKTERSYANWLALEFPGCCIEYESISLKLACGARYTPDWVVHKPDGRILIVEVKNAAYKHASYGRAVIAFKQARIEYPEMDFRWVEKTKDGWNMAQEL